jgi:hypothetical protein
MSQIPVQLPMTAKVLSYVKGLTVIPMSDARWKITQQIRDKMIVYVKDASTKTTDEKIQEHLVKMASLMTTALETKEHVHIFVDIACKPFCKVQEGKWTFLEHEFKEQVEKELLEKDLLYDESPVFKALLDKFILFCSHLVVLVLQ